MARHVRIDEGVKRGPRVPSPPMQHRPDGRFAGKLPADLDDQQIMHRIAAGERASDIAHELGVTPAALYIRYSGNQDYKLARKHGTGVRVDMAEKELEVASDPLSLARAREVHRSVAWRASVEHPDEYGQKQEVTVVHTVPDNVLAELVELRAELRVAPQLLQRSEEIINGDPARLVDDSGSESGS